MKRSPRRGRAARRARSTRRLVLLGPQDPKPGVGKALGDLENDGVLDTGASVALITAGWRDKEGELETVEPALRSRAIDLGLYRRAERIAEADPDLARAHKEVQDRLKLLRRAYNTRLAALITAHEKLLELPGDDAVLGAELEDSMSTIRALDGRHLDRVTELRDEFQTEHAPSERDAVVTERRDIDERMAETAAVVIAGGHIATLLNRLRLFGGVDLFGDRPVISWSAGSMALGARVVLFHDRPPWGAGNPEVFDHGLGLADDVVPLPNATERLVLDDRRRTARLAARFSPAACLLLDPGTRVDRVDGVWNSTGRVKRLDRAGRQIRFRTGQA